VPDVPYYPNILGQAHVIKRVPFVNPSRQRLLQLIREAPPEPIGASLENVVEAWQEMGSIERNRHPLRIGSNATDYLGGFINADANRQLPSALNWTQNVIFASVKVRPGNLAGIFFLNGVEHFDAPRGPEPLSFTIHLANLSHLNKAYLASIFQSGKQLTLFWHGSVPVLSTNGFPKYELQLGANMAGNDFALR
jgi:hypothetical protein